MNAVFHCGAGAFNRPDVPRSGFLFRLVDRRQPLAPPGDVWRHGYHPLNGHLGGGGAAGAASAFEPYAWLHKLITFSGGLYLCWMSWQLLWAAARRQALAVDLLTNLANPKAVIYFGSVSSLFVGDNIGAGAHFGIFALIVGETLLWFSLVAVVFVLPAMRCSYQRLARWINGGVTGVLFAGFGINLVLSR